MHAKFELTRLSNERAHAIVVAVILNMQRLVQIVQDHQQIQKNQHAQMLKNTFLTQMMPKQTNAERRTGRTKHTKHRQTTQDKPRRRPTNPQRQTTTND